MTICLDLCYLGVPIEGSSYPFGDNKALVDNTLIPSLQLKKHHNILSWHTFHQGVVCDIVRIVHIETKNNPPDKLIKHHTSHEWYHL